MSDYVFDSVDDLCLADFPKEEIAVKEKHGCQICPFMQEFVYGEDFGPECSVNSTVRIPPHGTPPECPLRKFDIVVTLNTGR